MKLNRRIGLISSPGGHFYELLSLKDAWSGKDIFWVTIQSIDTESRLKYETVYYANSPTTRNVWNLIRNFWLSLRVLLREKPSTLISTGGPVCIPFFYVGRLLGIQCIYIESLTRRDSLSLTGKLIYPVASVFLVQWECLAEKYRKAQFRGQLL